MYPDSLLATQGVGSIDVGQAHVLLARDLGVGQDAAQVPLQAYAWATLVTLQVQRPPGADIGVYLISGIDAADRDRLQAVARHLQRAGTSDAASLSLLFAPNATSSNPRGLASQTLDPSKTFLLKANLSTVTTSGGVAPALALQAGMSSQPYSSPLSSAAEFLTFVWEASVTGTGGFYLNYNPVQSKAGLPDHLFADSDETSLRLLILLDAQSRELGPDRTIYAFNNCAVLAENVDPAAVELVAELSQPRAAQLIRLATLPAGNAGFELSRVNPERDGEVEGPVGLTQSLYNLVGYRIDGNELYRGSFEGLPVGPLSPTGSTGPDVDVWAYDGVVPVARFGIANSIPASTVLPSRLENPYAGFAGATGVNGPRQVRFELGFRDM
jgi:hypothetical protein